MVCVEYVSLFCRYSRKLLLNTVVIWLVFVVNLTCCKHHLISGTDAPLTIRHTPRLVIYCSVFPISFILTVTFGSCKRHPRGMWLWVAITVPVLIQFYLCTCSGCSKWAVKGCKCSVLRKTLSIWFTSELYKLHTLHDPTVDSLRHCRLETIARIYFLANFHSNDCILFISSSSFIRYPHSWQMNHKDNFLSSPSPYFTFFLQQNCH